MAGRKGSSGLGGGSKSAGGGNKFISADKALYENKNETLAVERLISNYGTSSVLSAESDGNGNISLSYAEPKEYFEQNSKTKYGIYELKTGITNAPDIHGMRINSETYKNTKSQFLSENQKDNTRSVGIDWNNVKSVSGPTYDVKDFIKSKGFKWSGAEKKWVK